MSKLKLRDSNYRTKERLVSAGACAFDPKFSLARKRCITFALSARTRSGLVQVTKDIG